MTTGQEHIDVNLVKRLTSGRVLVIGDIMLDAYMMGDAERISPEAPVPIVRVEEERHMLGGAGNVACNITALGGESALLGITGVDQAATDIEGLLLARGIHPLIVKSTERRTTVKTRIMARRQQMLRLDQENTNPLSVMERKAVMDKIRSAISNYRVIVLSDYAKGMFDDRFMEDFWSLLEEQPVRPKVLVDPKPIHFPLFKGSTLMTPNRKETGEGIHMPVGSQEEILAAGREILKTVHCEHVLSTLGPDGMALFMTPEEVWHIPTVARAVFDVSGAGDTVIATLALGLSVGIHPLKACVLANHAAGIVVGKVGAATASPEELVRALQHAGRVGAPERWL